MHVVFISPEVWPLTRVGGLAEIAHDLPLALAARGHRVDVIAPKGRLSPELEAALVPSGDILEIPVSWRNHRAGVARLNLSEGVTVHLVVHDNLFDREGLYGNAYGDYEDNAERFIFFSRAALELAQTLGPVDAIHANDWATGLVPLYLKSLYADRDNLKGCGSLMTIHNLGKQGVFWHYDMPLTGLGWEYFTADSIEFYGKINFLKAGLVYADLLSTVSPTYTREILTPELGEGLDGVLRARRDRLETVTNGIDPELWNPATDPHLAARYTPDDLAPKATCREALRARLGLEVGTPRPLLVFLGRLVERRGLEILLPVIPELIAKGADLLVMGFGEDRYHAQLGELARSFSGRMAFSLGYDMVLAHQAVAGADLMLLPSRYEPCGLHQFHAMRYGAVPVARATGGLVDTISQHTAEQPGLGFKFGPFEPGALLEAVAGALAVRARTEEWRGIMRRGMTRDFSWGQAAAAYEGLYQRAQVLRQAR